ncbi:MAG TPA: ComF family protein [Rhodocyclaceae bacterium]
MVYKSIRQILDSVLPPRCRCCAVPLEQGQLCDPCSAALPWNASACRQCALPMLAEGLCPQCLRSPPAFDSSWVAFRLQAPVQQAIHALKYHADFGQAHWLAAQMLQALPPRRDDLPSLLIPVPLHPWRLMRRGYNQAVEIGRHLSTALGLPMALDTATRRRQTEDQIGQRASARRRNMRGAFSVGRDLSGLHIALIDDVMTTGATFNELAAACRRAGARRIEAWAVARTP